MDITNWATMISHEIKLDDETYLQLTDQEFKATLRYGISVEKIQAALEEVDRRIADLLESEFQKEVLFNDEDDAGRHDYAVAIYTILTR